jgi:Tfp pilus assembly protein PilF
MRFSSVALPIALLFAAVSPALHAQRPDDQIDAKSLALLATGRAQLAAGNLEVAAETLETALVVDPRNRGAFVALGDVARARSLPGQAVRYYREALLLDPNDLAALKGQGEALVTKGALVKARENLAKIKKVCRTSACPEATQLAALIARGAPQAAMAAPAPASAGKE